MESMSVQKTFYKIGDFISWYKNETLVLSPNFQRRSVWKPATKSYLIDTILRGLPIPIIFLRDRGVDLKTYEPTREVIDGQQRLRTVLAYVNPSLLKDFDPIRDDFKIKSSHNRELADKDFASLTPDLQKAILEYQFDVHVLPSYVDDRDVIAIFRRMNSTNYALNAQELRNSRFFGEFKTSVYMLAEEQLNRWRDWKTFSIDDIARMLEVELTSEFIMLILQRQIVGKSKPAIDKAYERYDENYPERGIVEERFHIVMDTIDDKLGKTMKELPFGKRTLIYSLFTCFYNLLFGLETSLVANVQPKPISQEHISWIKLAGERILKKTAPERVLNATARRTTNPKERKTLFDYLSSIQK